MSNRLSSEIVDELTSKGVPYELVASVVLAFANPLFRAMKLPHDPLKQANNLNLLLSRDPSRCHRAVDHLSKMYKASESNPKLWLLLLRTYFKQREPKTITKFRWANMEEALMKSNVVKGRDLEEKVEALRILHFENFRKFEGLINRLHSEPINQAFRRAQSQPQVSSDNDPMVVHYWDNYNKYGGF